MFKDKILLATDGPPHLCNALVRRIVEVVKINVIGTDNILEEAVAQGVKRVVCLSTDKAAYPINAMGISKAMMGKTFTAKARMSKDCHLWYTLWECYGITWLSYPTVFRSSKKW